MNSPAFYIGLGAGLALAAGLRPFLPALLAGGLGSANALGVDFSHGGYEFLESGWWLGAVAAAMVASYVLQLRVGAERFDAGPGAAAVGGLAIGIGAVLFAGTLADHGGVEWAGLLGGAAAALLGQAVARPIFARARLRLPDRNAREALTIYLDGAALAVAVLVSLVHPFGYVFAVLFAWMLIAARMRSKRKFAGLRILGR